jgi:hypothetical protein
MYCMNVSSRTMISSVLMVMAMPSVRTICYKYRVVALGADLEECRFATLNGCTGFEGEDFVAEWRPSLDRESVHE